MRPTNRMATASLAQIVLVSVFASLAQAQAPLPRPGERQPPPPQPSQFTDENLSILMRGPVHEAYAQPFILDPEPGLEVPNMPPPDIREVPPGYRPEGSGDVQWIPGYWGWDDEAGFIWISGIWRDAPPEMRWLPGYWSRMGDSVRWVRGLWLRMDVDAVTYLPEPPPSREQGPDGEAPENHFWVPGIWLYEDGEFFWRDGFWAPIHEEYVWTPAQHHWTPRGSVFVDGYWDYPLEERGVLFAPIARPERVTANFVYTPSVVLEPPSVLVHMFVRPAYNHYCFGDYYDAPFARRGFVSWVSYRSYDPLRMFYRFCRPDFFRVVHHRHDFFVNNRDWRPPHHWRDFRRYRDGINDRDGTGINIAVNFNEQVRSRTDHRFVQVTTDYRERHSRTREFYHNLVVNRQKGEIFKGKEAGKTQLAARMQMPEEVAPDRRPGPKGQPRKDDVKGAGQKDKRLPPPPKVDRPVSPKQKGFDRPDEPKQKGKDRPDVPKQKSVDRPEPPKKDIAPKQKDFDTPKQKGSDRPDLPKQKGPDRPEPPKKDFDAPKQKGSDRPDLPKQKGPDRPEPPKKDFDAPKQKGSDRPDLPKQKGADRPEPPKKDIAPKQKDFDAPDRPKQKGSDRPDLPKQKDSGPRPGGSPKKDFDGPDRPKQQAQPPKQFDGPRSPVAPRKDFDGPNRPKQAAPRSQPKAQPNRELRQSRPEPRQVRPEPRREIRRQPAQRNRPDAGRGGGGGGKGGGKGKGKRDR